MEPQTTYAQEQNKRIDIPYYRRLTIPKNTPIDTPLEDSLELPRGESEFLWLEFPRGCGGLVGIQLWRYTWQVFPRPAGEWFVSDNATIRFRFREVFQDVPYTLTIKAYNADQVYDHSPWIALEMVSLRNQAVNNIVALMDFLGRTE